MAEQKTNAARMAAARGMDYEMVTYECSQPLDGVTVAGLISADPSVVYKTLVAQGSSRPGAYYIFVVPVAAELNLKRAAIAAGEKSIAMISAKDILKVTGYVRGGCSPIGMRKQYPTYMDVSAGTRDKIYVSAGRLGAQIKISPDDILSLTGGHMAELV